MPDRHDDPQTFLEQFTFEDLRARGVVRGKTGQLKGTSVQPLLDLMHAHGVTRLARGGWFLDVSGSWANPESPEGGGYLRPEDRHRAGYVFTGQNVPLNPHYNTGPRRPHRTRPSPSPVAPPPAPRTPPPRPTAPTQAGETLEAFLLGCFSVFELRQFVERVAPDAEPHVRWQAPRAQVVSEVHAHLGRRGQLDMRFYAALLDERPRLRDRILRLAQTCRAIDDALMRMDEAALRSAAVEGLLARHR
jgi:hypothetical protein